MKFIKIVITLIVSSITLFAASQISGVKVDLLKGYAGNVEAGLNVRYYLGTLQYSLNKGDNDSIAVDFTIAPVGGVGGTVEILEKAGDVGLVKLLKTDTLRTVLFRCKIIGEPAAQYTAIVTANAVKSGAKAVIDELITRLIIDEKFQMIIGGDGKSLEGSNLAGFGTNDLAIKQAVGTAKDTILGLRACDGPHGVRWPLVTKADPTGPCIYGCGTPSTFFPTESALACTWNTDLVFQVGAGIGKEARAKYAYCNLGPMADLVRHPLGGRSFETYSEDPVLCGKLAAAQSRGLQSVGCIACPKHLTCYNKENMRYTYRSVVHERAVRELFLEPFRMCVEEGNCGAIMTAYNQVEIKPFSDDFSETQIEEGIMYASANYHLLKEIVRDEWGFNGVIMTDWEASKYSKFKYVYPATLDLEMPIAQGFLQLLTNPAAATDGGIELNNKLTRVLKARMWANDGKFFTKEAQILSYKGQTYEMNSLLEANRAVALKAGQESIVLAKNDAVGGKKLLPIDKNGTYTIAVIGSWASVPLTGGGGSSKVVPKYLISALVGLTERKGAKITITNNAVGADYAIVFVAPVGETEDKDRITLELPDADNNLVKSTMLANPNTIVVYGGGSASNPGEWAKAPAILIAFYSGQEQGYAIADAIFGEINPSGKLAVTFQRNASQLPNFATNNFNQIIYTSADSAHGYFWFDKAVKTTPLFPFGHGLSYTSFVIEEAIVTTGATVKSGEQVDVLVSVKNIGAMKGAEVVQVYVKPPVGPDPRRVKDLKGFAKVEVLPNQSKTVTISLKPHDFEYYKFNDVTKKGSWYTQPGAYQILVGSSSADIQQTKTITIN
jgi:beta-glucosidase